MSRARRILAILLLGAGPSAMSCKSAERATSTTSHPPVKGTVDTAVPGHDFLQDDSKKEGPRLMPAEVYMRSYLAFFDNKMTPLELEEYMRGLDQGAVFDRWSDYLAPLGFPDYKLDIARQRYTNALMLATFERMGIALCLRKAEEELSPNMPPPIAKRRIYAFDMTAQSPTDAEFIERFDVMHRTLLGYPVALAETDRASRFLEVFRDIVTRHSAPNAPFSRFTPQQAGWAGICYGLVRHPEFHMY